MRANDSVADPILNLKGPHPEEPAIAGVSKDGQGPQRMGPSFETRPADAPQDEVRKEDEFRSELVQIALRHAVQMNARFTRYSQMR
jgi:hypothetical protein